MHRGKTNLGVDDGWESKGTSLCMAELYTNFLMRRCFGTGRAPVVYAHKAIIVIMIFIRA